MKKKKLKKKYVKVEVLKLQKFIYIFIYRLLGIYNIPIIYIKK